MIRKTQIKTEKKMPRDIPDIDAVKGAIWTLVQKVQEAEESGRKVSKEAKASKEILLTLLDADDCEYGGWVIYQP